MSYIPIEYNNNACVKLKEIIYQYVVLGNCENFDISDLVKFCACQNRNFLMPFCGVKRPRGRAVSAPDFESRGRGFESRWRRDTSRT